MVQAQPTPQDKQSEEGEVLPRRLGVNHLQHLTAFRRRQRSVVTFFRSSPRQTLHCRRVLRRGTAASISRTCCTKAISLGKKKKSIPQYQCETWGWTQDPDYQTFKAKCRGRAEREKASTYQCLTCFLITLKSRQIGDTARREETGSYSGDSLGRGAWPEIGELWGAGNSLSDGDSPVLVTHQVLARWQALASQQ